MLLSIGQLNGELALFKAPTNVLSSGFCCSEKIVEVLRAVHFSSCTKNYRCPCFVRITALVPTLPKVSACKSYLQKPAGLHLVQDKCLRRESVIIQFLQRKHILYHFSLDQIPAMRL